MRDDWPFEITHQYTLEQIADGIFELIEDQTIDIDSIEELDTYLHADTYDWEDVENNIKTTNILIQALKHLNKEIQSIKK